VSAVITGVLVSYLELMETFALGFLE